MVELVSATLLKQGAEAKIYLCDVFDKKVIVKERFSKSYRHPTLDQSLGKERTKSEARALMRCRAAGIATPAVYFVDVDRCRIGLEYVDGGVTVNEFLVSLGDDDSAEQQQNLRLLAANVGRTLARIHLLNLVHGDLTTSNMMLRAPVQPNSPLLLIDFGLSYAEASAEDKAVDLYVLERAFLSTHPTRRSMFQEILDNYGIESRAGGKEVLRKLEEVRLRGRKRTMLG